MSIYFLSFLFTFNSYADFNKCAKSLDSSRSKSPDQALVANLGNLSYNENLFKNESNKSLNLFIGTVVRDKRYGKILNIKPKPESCSFDSYDLRGDVDAEVHKTSYVGGNTSAYVSVSETEKIVYYGGKTVYINLNRERCRFRKGNYVANHFLNRISNAKNQILEKGQNLKSEARSNITIIDNCSSFFQDTLSNEKIKKIRASLERYVRGRNNVEKYRPGSIDN